MYDRAGGTYIADHSRKGRFISLINKDERITTTCGTFYFQKPIYYKVTVWDKYLQYIKPILRPLSDFTKEIEVNGQKFVPIDKLSELHSDYVVKQDGCWFFIEDKCDTNYIELSTSGIWVQKLFEWHFDLHNLIKNGLAIDINTLNK